MYDGDPNGGVPQTEFYSYFRVRTTPVTAGAATGKGKSRGRAGRDSSAVPTGCDKRSHACHMVSLSGFELYGTLRSVGSHT